MKTISRLVMLQIGCLVLQAACLVQAPAPAWTHAEPDRGAAAPPRTLVPYFTPAGSQMAAPDADGFIRRWMLEPIVKPNRTKTVFTGSHVREALNTQYFPDQFTVLPYKGDKVTVAGHYLAWHALDSNNFDVRLFRFAYGLNKTTYGVIFWAVTVVNSPRDMKHARLAVGSNAASMSWLNGGNVVGLLAPARRRSSNSISRATKPSGTSASDSWKPSSQKRQLTLAITDFGEEV